MEPLIYEEGQKKKTTIFLTLLFENDQRINFKDIFFLSSSYYFVTSLTENEAREDPPLSCLAG